MYVNVLFFLSVSFSPRINLLKMFITNLIGRGGGIWGSGDADVRTDKERESSG